MAVTSTAWSALPCSLTGTRADGDQAAQHSGDTGCGCLLCALVPSPLVNREEQLWGHMAGPCPVAGHILHVGFYWTPLRRNIYSDHFPILKTRYYFTVLAVELSLLCLLNIKPLSSPAKDNIRGSWDRGLTKARPQDGSTLPKVSSNDPVNKAPVVNWWDQPVKTR